MPPEVLAMKNMFLLLFAFASMGAACMLVYMGLAHNPNEKRVLTLTMACMVGSIAGIYGYAG